MPAGNFSLTQTTSPSVWWMVWQQTYRSGRVAWHERRANFAMATRFAKRHGLPIPESPDTRRRKDVRG